MRSTPSHSIHPKSYVPKYATKTAMMRPVAVTAVYSPYPTVVAVMLYARTSYERVEGILVKLYQSYHHQQPQTHTLPDLKRTKTENLHHVVRGDRDGGEGRDLQAVPPERRAEVGPVGVLGRDLLFVFALLRVISGVCMCSIQQS